MADRKDNDKKEEQRFGLDPQALALIVAVLKSEPNITRAAVFGSRAKGTFRPNSDIDLVVWGELGEAPLSRLAAELDELPLPYLFDLKHAPSISSAPLREEIERNAIDILNRVKLSGCPVASVLPSIPLM